MWGLWLMPLLGLIFLTTAIVAVVFAIVRRPKEPEQWLGLAALPFGCTLLPVAVLMLIAGANALTQTSDRELFAEVWGFTPNMREQQMLADDFGGSNNRWIYMRMEPGAHDRQRLIDVTRPSSVTPEQFDFFGETRQFLWWETACEAPVVREADGYRGWRRLVVLDCPERRQIYFMAHRP